jgi:hypothetical protein
MRPRSAVHDPQSPFTTSNRYQPSTQVLQTLQSTNADSNTTRQFQSGNVPASPHGGKRTPRTPSSSSRSPSPSANIYFLNSHHQNSPSNSGKILTPTTTATKSSVGPSITVNPRNSPRQNNFMYSPSGGGSSTSSPSYSDISSPNTTPGTPRTPKGTLPPLSSRSNRSPRQLDENTQQQYLVQQPVTEILAVTTVIEEQEKPDRSDRSERKKTKKRTGSRTRTKDSSRERPAKRERIRSEKSSEVPSERTEGPSTQRSSSHQHQQQQHHHHDESYTSESDSASSTPPTPTRTRRKSIRNYKKGDLIGQGANGRVYMSFDADNYQFFAIKEVTFANVPSNILEDVCVFSLYLD